LQLRQGLVALALLDEAASRIKRRVNSLRGGRW
jgi:hypothetical protein